MAGSNESFDDLDELDAHLKGKSVKSGTELAQHEADTKWALKLLSDFKSGSQSSVWLNVKDRAKVVGQLEERVKTPTKINQADTWLCGITSAVRAWADDDPVDYAWLGIQLFSAGVGRLGKGKVLGEVIRPSFELKQSEIPKDMEEADWIVLASVHETLVAKHGHDIQKGLGVKTYSKDEGLFHYRAWQNPSEVIAAYKAMGYKNVVDNTSTMSPKGINDLNKANEYLRAGYRVSWLINMRMLYDDQRGTQGLLATSDHWVGMLEMVNIIGDFAFAFEVFSWGKRWRLPQNAGEKKLRVNAMLQNFHGFVAARMY